jgi:hypothetical protein
MTVVIAWYNLYAQQKHQKEKILQYDQEVFKTIYETDDTEKNETFNALLDQRMLTVDCYFNLLETNTNMEVFYKIFLRDYHVKLIPLVYFNRNLAYYEASKGSYLFS